MQKLEKESRVATVNNLQSRRTEGLLVLHSSSERSITITRKPVWPLKMRSPQFKAWPNIVPWLMKMFFIDRGA